MANTKLINKALIELEKEGILNIVGEGKWRLTEKGKLEREKMMVLFSSIKSID